MAYVNTPKKTFNVLYKANNKTKRNNNKSADSTSERVGVVVEEFIIIQFNNEKGRKSCTKITIILFPYPAPHIFLPAMR
jgi:hypothetical protein